MTTANSDYDRFTSYAQTFMASHLLEDILGDSYDQPGVVVYQQATKTLPGGGKVEVNATTPNAPDFAWEVEITINDKQTGRFIHFILQRDHSVVETYGKTIIPVSPARSAEITAVLAELAPVS